MDAFCSSNLTFTFCFTSTQQYHIIAVDHFMNINRRCSAFTRNAFTSIVVVYLCLQRTACCVAQYIMLTYTRMEDLNSLFRHFSNTSVRKTCWLCWCARACACIGISTYWEHWIESSKSLLISIWIAVDLMIFIWLLHINGFAIVAKFRRRHTFTRNFLFFQRM